MKFFALDLETTGLDKEFCQILEIGVIFFDTDNPTSYQNSKKFHRILKFDEPIVGQPFALQLNNRLMRIISGVDDVPQGCELLHYYDYETCLTKAIQQFADWAQNLLDEGENFRVNLLGKNVGAFDLQWLTPYVKSGEKYGGLFRHRVLDVGGLCALPSDDVVPGLVKCLERCGFGGPSDYHSALGDSWDCIRVLVYKWNIALPEDN